jgi:hypothetical protein
MILVANAEKALLTRYSPYKNSNFRTQFIGVDRHKDTDRPDSEELFPIAYLVEQGPHTQLRPHFHEAFQFQVFMYGGGRIGGHAAAAGLGHFVGPYTGYGPIVAGEQGLGYMTLRNSFDPGAQWLPENSARMREKRVPRREVTFEDSPPESTLLAVRADTCSAPLMEQTADGMGAWSYQVAAGQTAIGPSPATGGGQFWLVMSGSMVDTSEGLLPKMSVVFVSPDEAPFAATSGPEGLHVFALQFPRFGASANVVEP